LRETCAQIAQGANVIPLVSKDAIIAYRADKVAADIQRVEGYAVPFRNLADFGMK
jgi:peptide/nickel transport system substrate-binding protein